MTVQEFKKRFEKEEIEFLKLHNLERVSFNIETTNPMLGPQFAEKLILCPDLASAQILHLTAHKTKPQQQTKLALPGSGTVVRLA